MRPILLLLLAVVLVSCRTPQAEEPLGSINFVNSDIKIVLNLYQQLSGLDLLMDSSIARIHPITIQAFDKSPAELQKLIEQALREQRGIVITRLDDKRASVTYNDALRVAPTKEKSKE